MYLVSDHLPLKAALTLFLRPFPAHPSNLGYGCWSLLSLDALKSPYGNWTKLLLLMTLNNCQCLSFHYFGCYEHFTFPFIAVDQILVFLQLACVLSKLQKRL